MYPPAKAAFVQTRNDTETAFLCNITKFELFLDLAALNRRLGDGLRTANVFAYVVEKNPAAAKLLYHVAERYLLATGRFDACEPFLDPHERMSLATQTFQMMKRAEEERPKSEREIPKLARRFYIRDVGTLIALLVLNHRLEEANKVHKEALIVLDDEEFRTTLNAAMTGHIPHHC